MSPNAIRSFEEGGSEGRVMDPHHLELGRRLIRHRLGQPEHRPVERELAVHPQRHAEQPRLQ